MMHEPLLTIIIPTYNRCDLLERGLTSIVPQVVKANSEVQLYISDNCSEDGTPDVVRRFQTLYPDAIAYKRQATNIGFEANFKDAISCVHSKYVALIGDDDYLMNGYVETVVAVLKRHRDVGLVHVNALTIESDGSCSRVRNPLVNFGKEVVYATGGAFLLQHHHIPSLITQNVFNREAFLRAMAEVQEVNYPGYAWFAGLCHSIMDKSCVYIDRPLLYFNNPPAKRWETDAAWFYICGLGHVFKDVDAICPGIFSRWRESFTTSFYAPYCLASIARNRALYRTRIKELREYAVSEAYYKEIAIRIYLSPCFLKGFLFFRRIRRSLKNRLGL